MATMPEPQATDRPLDFDVVIIGSVSVVAPSR